MIHLMKFAAAGFLAATLMACSSAFAQETKGPVAAAAITNAKNYDHKITGTATFTSEPAGVKIVVDVDGLPPGKHGIHIHEKPDLTAPDLSSAGPHYNPDGADHHHAGPNDPERHAGDLGNIEVDDKGHGHLEMTDTDLTVDGPKNPVVGHSIIIHAKEDDLHSQPAGESGPRIAGGAIEIVKSTGRQEK